jgi:hypothetical protein
VFKEYAENEWGVTDPEIKDQCWSIVKKYKKSLENNQKKNSDDKVDTLEEFVPSRNLELELRKLFSEVIQMAEQQFLGFSWDHLLETSPDYQGGRTFSDFDEDENAFIRMCEVQVVEQPKEKKSAKGTVYYVVKVEDANSRSHIVTFWQDDWDRFKDELSFWEGEVRMGNFLRIRLKKPDPPFKNYTFEAPSKQFRWKEVPKDKDQDFRLQVMARPTIVTVADEPAQVTGPTTLIDLDRILEF